MPELKIKSLKISKQEVEPQPEVTKAIHDILKPEDKLERIKKNVLQYAGKRGMNPFLYIKNVLDPLFSRLAAGDKGVEAEIKALPDSPVPDIDKTWLEVSKISGGAIEQ